MMSALRLLAMNPQLVRDESIPKVEYKQSMFSMMFKASAPAAPTAAPLCRGASPAHTLAQGMDNAFSRLLKALQPWMLAHLSQVIWPPAEFGEPPKGACVRRPRPVRAS
jgi:hypothetical protein